MTVTEEPAGEPGPWPISFRDGLGGLVSQTTAIPLVLQAAQAVPVGRGKSGAKLTLTITCCGGWQSVCKDGVK